MRKFDFYEFAGVLVPGTILLVGAAVCCDPVKKIVFDADLSLGEASLSVIVAYGLGHLIQAFGNLIEWAWWRAWGGMPSDWPRSGKRRLLADGQIRALEDQLERQLRFETAGGVKSFSSESWHSIVRQVYAAVADQGRATRVDVFNGNYGLNRGLAAALLVVGIMALVTHGWSSWKVVALLTAGAGTAMYRMHRFGVHYARELFVQFVQLPGVDCTGKTPRSSPS